MPTRPMDVAALDSTTVLRRSSGSGKLRPVRTPLSASRSTRPNTPTSAKGVSMVLVGTQGGDRRHGAAADDRQLTGYTKIKKLGVGGCGTVWQVVRAGRDGGERCDEHFALKQISKEDGAVVSGVVEARVGLKLFPNATVVCGKLLHGLRHAINVPATNAHLNSMDACGRSGGPVPPDDLSLPPTAGGTTQDDVSSYIVPLLAVVETKRDLWLAFEHGGDTLHNALFDIRGEFVRGSRTYRIRHRPLYTAMRDNVVLLKSLLRQLLLAIQALASRHLVHADIKPDNILVQHAFSTPSAQTPVGSALHPLTLSAKLIDFGSAFTAMSPKLSSAHTPEYVPPDILELVRTKHQTNHVKAYFDAHCRPHSFDMWSVGCVFLEIACGVPLWLPYKARVGVDGEKLVTGLLAATGRNADKIAARQLHVVANLRKCIRDCGGMNIDSRRWTHGVDLMQRMLEVDPAHRIAPVDALAHPFLAATIAPSSQYTTPLAASALPQNTPSMANPSRSSVFCNPSAPEALEETR